MFIDKYKTDPMMDSADLAGSGNMWNMLDPFSPANDLNESGFPWIPDQATTLR